MGWKPRLVRAWHGSAVSRVTDLRWGVVHWKLNMNIYIYECKIDNVVNVNYNQLQMLYNPSIHVYDINRQRGRERETESCFFLHAPQSHPPHIVGGATVHSLSSNIIEPSSSCGFWTFLNYSWNAPAVTWAKNNPSIHQNHQTIVLCFIDCCFRSILCLRDLDISWL